MSKILLGFFNNNFIEILIIGTLAYLIVGIVMRLLRDDLGIWLGKHGGRLAWFVVALIISTIYHGIKDVFLEIRLLLGNLFLIIVFIANE